IMTKRHLVLFTAEFPYGKSETFLENEIIFLCDAFSTVTIVPKMITDKEIRPLPANCIIEPLHFRTSILAKLKRLSYFFKKSVIQEFKIVRKEYRKTINIPILRTILSSYFEAEQYLRYISAKSQKNSNTLFYSYWCDSAAIGIALAKQQGKIQKGISRCHGCN